MRDIPSWVKDHLGRLKDTADALMASKLVPMREADRLRQSISQTKFQLQQQRANWHRQTEIPEPVATQLKEAERQANDLTERIQALHQQGADATQVYLRCQAFLDGLPDNSILLEEPQPPLEPSKAALELLRKEIKQLKEQAHELAMAASSPEEVKRKAHDYVTSRAAKLTVNTTNARFDVLFRIPGFNDPLPDPRDPLALLCLLFPDVMANKIISSAPASGIPMERRQSEASRIADALFESEHREELIIRALLSDGVIVHRRVDASPEAVLGLSRGTMSVHDRNHAAVHPKVVHAVA